MVTCKAIQVSYITWKMQVQNCSCINYSHTAVYAYNLLTSILKPFSLSYFTGEQRNEKSFHIAFGSHFLIVCMLFFKFMFFHVNRGYLGAGMRGILLSYIYLNV